MAGATKGGAGQAQSGQPPDGTGEAGTLNAGTVRVGTAAGLMPAYAARPDAHATAAVIVGFAWAAPSRFSPPLPTRWAQP